MVLRKILSNKWMFLCLLMGAVLMIGMVASVPMYTDGILTRMLIKDMETFQQTSNIYPGSMSYTYNAGIADIPTRLGNLNYFNSEMGTRANLGSMPISGQTRIAQLTWIYAKREDGATHTAGAIKIVGQTDIMEHIELIAGRLPESEPVDGVYEVLVSETLMFTNGFSLDETYLLADVRSPLPGSSAKEPLYDYQRTARVVGIFKPVGSQAAYWPDAAEAATTAMVMDYDLVMRDFVYTEDSFLQSYTWYTTYDYNRIDIEDMETIVSDIQANVAWFRAFGSGKVVMPAQAVLEGYAARAETLRTMLSVMQVPILLMLAFYIFMVTQLILDSEKNEIAVLKSRGASRAQIMLIYLVESLLIVGAALVIGPWLGFLICNVLGASNGFLEFVARAALRVSFTPQTMLYCAAAAVFIVFTMLIPAFFASRVTIVEQKILRVRGKIALWKKTGIDLILLGIAAYGMYAFQNRQAVVAATDAEGLTVPVDPLLFLISTAFIIGAGLLFLRVYPMLVRGIYFVGKKLWSPALYASFVQVGRSGGQEQFLMLFLIITLSLGIFSANSARAINLNAVEKVQYHYGADMVLSPVWRSNAPSPDAGPPSGEDSSAEGSETFGYANTVSRGYTYQEPLFETYTTLPGVDMATKVLLRGGRDVSLMRPGKSSVSTDVMAVEPYMFGQVADMPEELLRPHWNNYLNLLTVDPSAALVSRELLNRTGLAVGDTIQVTWGQQNPMTLRVYGVIDYWPTMDPNKDSLLVCNYHLVYNLMSVEPYQVWFKMEEGASSAAFYEELGERKIRFNYLGDARQQLIQAKNEPMLQGTNGALTMAFIVTMVVSFFGFIIYWTLSIKSRVLQFGILRAMGMSMRSIISMLFWEQLLISGVAVIIGILVGGGTAQIFTPFLQMVAGAAEQVPPLRMAPSRADYIRIYAIVLSMLTIGFGLLGAMISRIRIAQALKLGED